MSNARRDSIEIVPDNGIDFIFEIKDWKQFFAGNPTACSKEFGPLARFPDLTYSVEV